MIPLPSRVKVVEVGPRDGLQNERVTVSTADKIRFINLLAATGLSYIEAGAFVSPKWVPQMADTEQVFSGIDRRPGVRYAALVPNLTGLERAAQCDVSDIAVFAAASETFSRRNINQTIEESLTNYAQVCQSARTKGMRVRGYVSTAFGCPYEGDVDVSRVAEVTRRLIDLGVDELAVSDTIGIAHPGLVRRVVEAVLTRVSLAQIALHFHDTRGTALANVLTGLELGVETFDASAGGLGGCPYAPGAAGNLATEELIYLLDGLGIGSGVRLGALLDASRFIEERLDHPLPSKYLQAVRARPGAGSR